MAKKAGKYGESKKMVKLEKPWLGKKLAQTEEYISPGKKMLLPKQKHLTVLYRKQTRRWRKLMQHILLKFLNATSLSNLLSMIGIWQQLSYNLKNDSDDNPVPCSLTVLQNDENQNTTCNILQSHRRNQFVESAIIRDHGN